jgi:hypothetical protein
MVTCPFALIEQTNRIARDNPTAPPEQHETAKKIHERSVMVYSLDSVGEMHQKWNVPDLHDVLKVRVKVKANHHERLLQSEYRTLIEFDDPRNREWHLET